VGPDEVSALTPRMRRPICVAQMSHKKMQNDASRCQRVRPIHAHLRPFRRFLACSHHLAKVRVAGSNPVVRSAMRGILPGFLACSPKRILRAIYGALRILLLVALLMEIRILRGWSGPLRPIPETILRASLIFAKSLGDADKHGSHSTHREVNRTDRNR
jgi:hypothetical protein